MERMEGYTEGGGQRIEDCVTEDKGTITLLSDVKQSLRKVKLNIYAEHILYIHHLLTGTTLPYRQCEIEDKMVRLFKHVERVLELTRARVPFGRNNFLNYYYVLSKLLDSLQQPELLLHRILC